MRRKVGRSRTKPPPTEETREKILAALGHGATYARAAVSAGVSYRDVQRWVEQGHLPRNGKHARRSARAIPSDVTFLPAKPRDAE